MILTELASLLPMPLENFRPPVACWLFCALRRQLRASNWVYSVSLTQGRACRRRSWPACFLLPASCCLLKQRSEATVLYFLKYINSRVHWLCIFIFIQIKASTVYNSLYAALLSNVRTKIEPPGDDGEQTSPSRRTSGLCNKKAIGWSRTRCWARNT